MEQTLSEKPNTMERYRNTGGDSGVMAYENGSDNIKVQFSDNSLYLYNYSKPGRHHVETMKRLALRGSGLNSYINKHVKFKYATMLR